MTKKPNVKASAEPPLAPSPNLQAKQEVDENPAGNATRQLEKPRVRSKAQADQVTLLEEGPNALPVSDYPLKKGPTAANSVDVQEQARSRARRKQA